MRFRPLLAGAAALTLALSLTACGDDGDDTSTDDSTETTASDTEDTAAETTEAETDETTEAETETTEGETETTVAEGASELTGLLLTPEDVGDTFVEGPYEPSDEPGPCGDMLDTDHPYDDIAGTVIGDEAQALFLQHEIRAYADEATAGETFAAAQDAFSCGADTAQEGLTLEDVTDVTDAVGGDAAAGVEFTDAANEQKGAIVFVQVGPVISVYQFVGPAASDAGPDPVAIVGANVAAIESALG